MHVQRIIKSKPLVIHPVQTSFIVIAWIIGSLISVSVVDGDMKA